MLLIKFRERGRPVLHGYLQGWEETILNNLFRLEWDLGQDNCIFIDLMPTLYTLKEMVRTGGGTEEESGRW